MPKIVRRKAHTRVTESGKVVDVKASTFSMDDYIKKAAAKRRSKKIIKDNYEKQPRAKKKKQEPLKGFMKHIKW